MPKYIYRAMNPSGQRVNGEYEANNKVQVMDMLSANGLYPLKIEEVSNKSLSEINFSFSKKVKVKDISIFCRQFYTMLDSGLSMNNALNILSKQLTNPRLKAAVEQIEDDVKKGEELSSAMKKFKDIFPNLLISMVESGELSGRLDEVMLRMSTHFEKENKINNKIKSAMIYPMVLAMTAAASVTVIMTFVMPTFLGMFEETGTELPFITTALIATSNFMTNRWYILVIIILGLIIGFSYFKRTGTGDEILSKIKLKIPAINKLNKMIIVSRFTRTLSTLLKCGVSLTQSLEIISDIVENKVAKSEIMSIRENVLKGEGLYSSLKNSEIFPQMMSSMVKIGEESGSLDGILEKTADFYDDDLEQTIQTTVALMEPAMIVAMALIIGTIVLAIIIPMFTMYGNIG